MVYTEIKEKSGKRYYYRVKSVREGNKVKKERRYLGVDLNKKDLFKKEKEADRELIALTNLLTEKELKVLEKIKKDFAKEPQETLENRYESFCALFTHDSTAIEGNTFTLQETANLLFERIVPAKSLREVNEVLNHKKAFDYILEHPEDITKEFILKLHELVIRDTLKPQLKEQIGKYRTVQVYIRGAEWLPPKPKDISNEIKNLLSWYSKNKKKTHPLIIASYFHAGFETIHPFIDGNGRVGRLLINFILHKNKYPMVNIPNSLKQKYYKALEESQIKGNLRPLVELLFDILKKNKLRF